MATGLIIGTLITRSVGVDIIVKSGVAAASGVGSGIKYFFTTTTTRKDVGDLKKLLDELDIDAEMKVVEAYINKITTDDENDATAISLKNLTEVIQKLHSEIDMAKRKIEEDQNITYIGSWLYSRQDITPHCKEIERLSKIFTLRFKLLLAIQSS